MTIQCKNPDVNVLKLEWRVFDPDTAPDSDPIREFRPEGLSIFTISGHEVVGCSEWMRADLEVFQHICDMHNAWVDAERVRKEIFG